MSLADLDRTLRTAAALYVAADVGVIDVVGPDARTFLHNLATNDVRSLPVGQGCEVFFTTHKAKVVGHAIAQCLADESFRLTVEAERVESLANHLNRYLISERVELNSRGKDWSMLRILGPKAGEHASSMVGDDVGSLGPWQSRTLSDEQLVRRQAALHLPGYDFIGPFDALAVLVDDWRRRGLPIIDDADLEAIRIESGWPRWGREMDESRFVVELDRIAAAISYAKGCYLGQEPIVMARDRGQVNRRLMGFRCDGDEPLPAGAAVVQGEIERFKATSSIYSSGWRSAIGLAFVYRGTQTAGTTLTVPTESGERRVVLSELPMIPG